MWGPRVRAAVNTPLTQRGSGCHHIRDMTQTFWNKNHPSIQQAGPVKFTQQTSFHGRILLNCLHEHPHWSTTCDSRVDFYLLWLCNSFLTFLIIYNNNKGWSGSVYKPKSCQQHLSLFHWPSKQTWLAALSFRMELECLHAHKTQEKQQVWRLSCTNFVLLNHLTAFWGCV